MSLLSIGAGIAAFGLEPTLTQFSSFVPFLRFTSSITPAPDFRQNLLGIIVTFLPALQAQWIILVYSAVGALLVLGTLMMLWPPGRRAGDLGLEAGLLIATTTLLFPGDGVSPSNNAPAMLRPVDLSVAAPQQEKLEKLGCVSGSLHVDNHSGYLRFQPVRPIEIFSRSSNNLFHFVIVDMGATNTVDSALHPASET